MFGQDSAVTAGEKLIKQALEQDKRDSPKVKALSCASLEELRNLDDKDRERKRNFRQTLQDWLGTGRYVYRLNPEVPVDRRGLDALSIVFAPTTMSQQPQGSPDASTEQRAMNDVLNNLAGVVYLDSATHGIREVEGFQLRGVKVRLAGMNLVQVYKAHVDYLQQSIRGIWAPSRYVVDLKIALPPNMGQFRPLGITKGIVSTYYCSGPPPP